ncbi:hypothetical protein, variant [Verruconis gallopava]|uniref:C2H2-type domain-containing protein n=1 Tax=Verruconis gallopava TaxID=253628 RepID=A0A0D2AMI7_9PEZI|nr:hypothetical protein, variant [Verruconis gallopava]KIW00349.1 hypothetical protein, variant [Verruconis gallopava]
MPQDLEILVDRRTDTHEPFLRVKYISDHMKARKEKNDWLGTVQNEQRRFQDCSVFLILVLAFADNAFEHISTPEELLRVQPFEGAPRVIPFHPKVKDQFVLRSRKGNAMTDNVFRNLYRPMVQRAGYKMERMQLYNIRRGVANIVKNHVPGSRLRQVMGHRSDNEFLRFYQTRLVDIDFQGIVLRGEQDSGIDYTRLLRSERGLRPPTELPASVKEGIESCLAGVANGTTEYYSLKKSLTQDAWRQFLKAWNDRIGHSSTGTHPTRTTSTLIPNSCELEGDLMMQETRAKILLRHFCLEFAKISEAFQADAFNIRQDDHLNVMKFLISYVRCKAQQHTFWYPTAFPICTLDDEGNPKYACPICSKDITAFNNPRRRPKHIHRCQQLQKQISDDYEPRHCYRCHLWFSDRTSYRDHCRSHYMHLDMFCGLWRESETVIVAARCPFCLSDHLAGSEWDARVVEFTEARTLQRHLRHHLQALPLAALLPCPHPLCDKAERLSRNDLINHLADSHGLDYDLIKGFRAPNTDVNSSSLEDDCSSKEITSGNEDEPPREISLTSATDLTCGQERVWQHRFGRDHRLQQGLEKAVLEEGQRSPDCATQLSPTDYSSLSFAIPIDVSGPKCGNKRQREVPAASSTESVLSQRHDLSWRKRVRTSRLV